MARDSALQTSASLLARLQHDEADQAAWGELVRRYGPLILGWCRRWRLPQADAEEVTQAVLVKLAEKLRAFRYDPSRSFRAYLKTLTRYAWYDVLEARKRPDVGSGDTGVLEALRTIEAEDDLGKRFDKQFDQELLAEAQHRVQERVEAQTWEAFRLTAVEGLSGADTGACLGVTVAAVFKAKSRVQRMLQEEVAKLEDAAARRDGGPP